MFRRFAAALVACLVAASAQAQHYEHTAPFFATPFTATGGGTNARTLAQFAADNVNVLNYMPGGGAPDGTNHQLSNYFATQAAAVAACPSLATLIGPNATTGTTHTSTTLDSIASMVGVLVGATVTDADGDIPAGTTVAAIQPAGAATQTVTLSQAATGSHSGDTITFSEGTTWWQSQPRDWCAIDAAIRGVVTALNAAGTGAINHSRIVLGSYNYDIEGLPINANCYSDANPIFHNVSAISNSAGAIEVTLASNMLYLTSNPVTIAGVASNTGANGTWAVTKIDATHFTLNGSTFSNSAGAGGTAAVYDGCALSGGFASSHSRIVIDLRGAEITCKTAGTACLNGLGSRDVEIDGGNINGSCTNVPAIGIAIGRTVWGVGADEWEFVNPTTTGCFSLTPFYNAASEQTVMHGGLFHNTQNAGLPYAGILDGGDHFLVSSPYVIETITQDNASSFNAFLALGTRWYPTSGTSTGLFVYGANFPKFERDYLTTADGVCVRLYQSAASNPNIGPKFDVHCEAIGATPVATEFLFTGSYATPTITAFKYRDMFVFANTQIFALDTGVTGATLNGGPEIYAFLAGGVASTALFDNGANYTVSNLRGIYLGTGITGFAPTVGAVQCSGAGTTGTCTLVTGSTVADGSIILTMGGSAIGATGAVDLAFPFKIGLHRANCEATLANGTVAPTTPAGIVIFNVTQTTQKFTWFFGAAESAGDTTEIHYSCRGI